MTVQIITQVRNLAVNVFILGFLQYIYLGIYTLSVKICVKIF